MKTKAWMVTLIIVVSMVYSSQVRAQAAPPSTEFQKYEVGMDFTTLTLNPGDTAVGIGGRFTYNWNRHIALEAAGYFSPGKCATCSGEITGNINEGLFGIKAGQRFKRFGIFGKVRPGLINFSQGFTDFVPNGSSTSFPFTVLTHGRTDFATDVGGVLEVYPKKHVLLRFDAGTIFDRVGRHTFHLYNFDPATGIFTPFNITEPGFTRRRFQFIAGVGFRF